ncbi:MAG: hypothetical protein WAV95_01280 [Azonexus sp.]
MNPWSRLIALLALVLLLPSCSSPRPMLMKVESEASLVRPLDRVVIVANGDLFPDQVHERFFQPVIDQMQDVFEKYGIESWVVKQDTKSLNPTESVINKVRSVRARYVLYFSASRVRGVDPEKTAWVRPENLVAGYTLSFMVSDLAMRKNVWKAELSSVQGQRAMKEEIPEIRAKLEEELLQAGLLNATNKLSLTRDKP